MMDRYPRGTQGHNAKKLLLLPPLIADPPHPIVFIRARAKCCHPPQPVDPYNIIDTTEHGSATPHLKLKHRPRNRSRVDACEGINLGISLPSNQFLVTFIASTSTMGFFRKKSTRQLPAEPLPDWDDTRWRSHLRSNALGTEHHCGIYVQMINDDRKEAARLHQNDDTTRARGFAESAIRNSRTVTALAALNPLSNALYQRSEPLAGYTSLVQIPEPARSGIVTLIFSAARLHMSYLTDTVNFLKEQFGELHVEQIQAAEGELYPLVNATVRDALSPAPATRADVDRELASAVKQYFGIDVTASSPPPPARSRTTPITSAATAATNTAPERPRTSAIGPAADSAVRDTAPERARTSTIGTAADSAVRGTTQDVVAVETEAQPSTEVRRTQTTPLSAGSSDLGVPVSPQLSTERAQLLTAPVSGPVPAAALPPEDPSSTRSKLYRAATAPDRYTQQAASAYPLGASEHATTAYPLGMTEGLSLSVDTGRLKRGRAGELAEDGIDQVGNGARETYAAAQKAMPLPPRPPTMGRDERSREGKFSPDVGVGTRSLTEFRNSPTHVRIFDDGDKALITRYEHLRVVLAM